MAYVEIELSEAIDILDLGGYVFFKYNGNIDDYFESIDSSEKISTLLEKDQLYKLLSCDINGIKFTEKQDALNEINRIFGD